MNISEIGRPNSTKFYLKDNWDWEKAALGFGPDQIGTLVPMAMHSFHRVTMGKML